MPQPPSIVSADRPLVLGSASPRRKEILAALGVPVRVVPGGADETWYAGEAPATYLARVVESKLADVVGRAGVADAPAIVVADTVVCLGEDVLGKPRDVDEAAELVGRLVGRDHWVRTRYAIARAPSVGVAAVARTVETRVTMREVGPADVRAYAETGEGLDKAGAYAVQGIGAFLVERIDGSYSNVVGLPASEVIRDLVALEILPRFPLPRS
ncbi:MAG TPA: Maf family protein [Polyangiaceae bacterium]|nr:Maf family protein [Polyangiaceae bacterium]